MKTISDITASNTVKQIPPQWKKLTYITVGLVSFVTILLELVQMRILSFIFWNHMVYLTISIALLGFGISGSLVAIFASSLTDRRKTLSKLLLGFGGSTALTLCATILLPFFGSYTSVLKVAFCYVIYLIPFVFAGAIVSIILSCTEYRVARLYAVDLLCAGLACIAFFFLLPLLEPTRLIGLIAIVMALLSFLWSNQGEKWLRLGVAAVAEIGILLVLCGSNNSLPLYPEAYKELFAYLSDRKEIEKTYWTPLCRIDVVGDKFNKIITQDGTANTHLWSAEQIQAIWTQIKHNLYKEETTIVFEIKHQPDLAIIGVGGGRDIIDGLGCGARSIVAAELNPATYEIMTSRYADYNGHLCKSPRLKFLNEEGRSMLRQQNKLFDVIQVRAIDTFAALSSGAYVLSENYLYTVESFQEMFNHLRTDGILSFMRWNSTPPKESLRLAALGCEAWKRHGSKTIDQQLFIYGWSNGWAVSLFKNSPFTKGEMEILAQAAIKRNLKVLYWPKILPADRQATMEHDYYLQTTKELQDCSSTFNELIAAYTHGQEKKFFANYPYLVKPSTDDSPFFFEYYKKNLFSLPDFNALRGNAACLTLYIVLLEATVFTVLAIFCPLWKFQRQGISVPYARSFSLYFTAIGIGFMLVEISLVQKNVLFLGNPLYSLPVVLASLLLSAGMGSWVVSKTQWPTRKAIAIFGGLLFCSLILLSVSMNSLFYNLMHLPLAIRMLTTALIVFPVGLLMGTFLPIGLDNVRTKAADYLPWAWGINGCSSVYGSFIAIVLAIDFGFTCSLFIGILVYCVAFLAALHFSQSLTTDKESQV